MTTIEAYHRITALFEFHPRSEMLAYVREKYRVTHFSKLNIEQLRELVKHFEEKKK